MANKVNTDPQWLRMTPEQKARKREHGRQWKRDHPEASKAMGKRAYAKQPYSKLPEERKKTQLEAGKRYRAKHPEAARERSRRRTKEESGFKDKLTDCRLRSQYNISLEDYWRLHSLQNGVCAICRKPETSKHKSGVTRRLSVDHDHVTGRVRGLLCHRHNLAIGLLQDDPLTARAAADYLEKK